MTRLHLLFAVLFAACSLHGQNIIANWNYNSIVGAPTTYNADIGAGTSSVVGALTATNAATGMDPVLNNGCGIQNGTNPGAWSFTANPGLTNESSGVQFNASTVGQQNIRFTWDQRWSNTATNTIRLQYTTDGVTWNNFTMDANNTTFCNGSINDGRFQNNGVGDQFRRISVNLSSIPAVNNNINFGIRILAAHYQTTSEFRQTATPTIIATAGTWRFDNVSIEACANVSIAAASNFAAHSENAGLVNIPITISNANNSAVVLNFVLSIYSDATPGEDYTWNTSLTIPANTNGIHNLPITIIDDNVAEKAERMVVKIGSGTNANISLTDNYQILFIKDNDFQAPSPTNELNLTLLNSFSNGASGSNSAEIVAFDPSVDRLYIANSIGGKLDIVNFSNPSAPQAVASISLAAYGNINSVVAHDSIVALAIESVPAQNNGKVVFLDYNGTLISQVDVGPMPDMICFNQNYTKILTANEGEPNATYTIDPEGSVSIIDLSPGYPNLTNSNVVNIGLTGYNGQASALVAQGIRIFSTSATVAQDLEPEYIAISEDNSKAFVTLQENNALLTIDLNTNTILSLTPFGYSSYDGASGNALDASDQSGSVLITGNLPIKGAFMPDAIQFKNINGTGYLFTANEGDSREFGSVIDANRLSSSVFNNVLDPTVFPDQQILRNNKFLGRLSMLKYSGDMDGDGDFDQLHTMGGRSFSIWNSATGALVFDSKALIEQITSMHPTFGAIFNASNTIGVPALKNRSDDKGPEPEGIALATVSGSNYVFISLERIGGVMIFNVDNPLNPIYVGYANNRSTSVSGPDLGSEGIIYINAQDSPNGNSLLLLANEVSSTLSIYQINTCADLSGAPISTAVDTVCANLNTTISATSVSNTSYQWLLNGGPIANANSPSISVNTQGSYSLAVNNSSLACVDTSNIQQITVLATPSVTAGTNTSLCLGTNITLNGGGAAQYTWNNGITNGVTFTPQNTSTYIVTGIGSNGCQDTASVIVTVLPIPVVIAGTDVSVCAGDSVYIQANGALTYSWDNGIVNNAQNPVISTITATVIGTDINGCSNSDQVVITALSLPVTDAGVDTSICNGEAITLTASGADSYSWNQNVTNGTSFIPTQSLVYQVIGTSTNGCSSIDSITVNLNTPPTVSLGNDFTICASETPYTLTPVSTGTNLTYDWSNGTNGNTIDILVSGSYSLGIIDGNNCSASDTVEVDVNENPIVSLPSDTTICNSQFPYTVVANVSNGSTLTWSNGSSSSSVSINNAETLTIEAINSFGCSAFDSVTISSDPCLAVDESSIELVQVYPNPVQSNLTVFNPFKEVLAIEIYALNGQLLFNEVIAPGSYELDFKQLASGQYMLKWKSSEVEKVVRITKH